MSMEMDNFNEIMDFFSTEAEKLEKEFEDIKTKDEAFLSSKKADKDILELRENTIEEMKIAYARPKVEPEIIILKTREQEILELEKEGFNPQQLEVIKSPYPIVNIAGPGSGKTKTLIAKITTQVREMNDLKRMLVLTFTNAAANEVLERLGKKFNKELDRKDYYSGTYHGIFYKLLRENSESLKIFGFTDTPRVLDSNEDKHTFEKVVEIVTNKDGKLKKKESDKAFYEAHGFMPLDAYYMINSMINMTPQSIKQIREYIVGKSKAMGSGDREELEQIINTFFKCKIQQNFISFGDILMYTHFLLEKDEKFRKNIQDKFDYILIDEYQDTNPIQANILSKIEKNNNSCIIGDPYQSIYRFLGASVKNIMNKSRAEGMNTIQLLHNYRSTQNIVELTNDIAKQFTEKVDNHQPCIAVRRDLTNEKIEVKEFVNQTFNVINGIKYRTRKGVSYKDMAILSRNNRDTYPIEAQLRREGIPFVKIGGNELYDSKEIRFMTSLTKLMLNNYSMYDFELVASHYKGMGDTTIDKISKKFLERSDLSITIKDIIKSDFSKFEGFSDLVFGKSKPNRDMDNLFTIDSNYKETELSFNDFKEALYDDGFGIIETMTKDAKTVGKRKEIESNIEYFENELEEEFKKGKDSLIEFISSVSLGQNNEKMIADKEDVITISTLHSAKGKEWRDVYIINAEDGKFPSIRGADVITKDEYSALLEEERRLLYVGVSRAKEKLMILSEGQINDFMQPLLKKPYINHYKNSR